MKRGWVLLVLVAVFGFALMAGVAEATLIEQDLATAPAGNKYITYDEATGLSWLDVNLTAGLSYNQLLANDIIGHGFTIASESQMRSLFQNMGAPFWNFYDWIYNYSNEESQPAYLSDMLKLGPIVLSGQNEQGYPTTSKTVKGYIYGQGSNAKITISHGTLRSEYNNLCLSSDFVNIEYLNSGHLHPDYVTDNTGWWVVSGEHNPILTTVPEPTTLLLLGTGLIGLWGFRKKFKK